MKKGILLICLFAAACKMPVPKKQNDSDIIKNISVAPIDSSIIKQKAITDLNVKKAKKIVDSLKSKFISDKDDFNNVIWYTHKRFGKYWPNRKTIYTEVRNDGYYNVVSNYYAEDWIFHKSIQVMVGTQKFETETVETYKPNNRQDNKGGMIWENVRYDVSNRNILNAIAADINKPVKIRFNGRQFYNDASMSLADKKAIKESLLFADALETINNNK